MTTEWWTLLVLVGVALFLGARPAEAAKQEPILVNDHLSLRFDAVTGRLSSLVNRTTGTEYLSGEQPPLATLYVDHRTGSMWEAMPRKAIRLENPIRIQVSPVGDQVLLVFHDDTYHIAVEVTATLDGSEFIRWQLAVRNEGTATVVRIDFPELSARRAAFPGERLVWPYREGQIIPAPRGENEILYPGIASMQWFEYGTKHQGLYVAVYDPEAAYKSFRFAGQADSVDLGVSLWPYVEPGQEWVSPPVEMGVGSAGDWYWAADRYRDWLVNKVRWTITTPDWVERMPGFGVQFIVNRDGQVVMPFSTLPSVARQVAERGGDILEIKGWHNGGFDTLYPEYTPATAAGGLTGLTRAVAQIAAEGGKLLFYENTRIADKASSWYKEQDGVNDVHSAFGLTYDEVWNNRPFSVMCPFSASWQEKLLSHQRPLVEMGGRGMFFDQTGAMHPILCYDQSHGHTTPATAFAAGHRAMFARFHALWAEAHSYLFITEGVVDYLGSFVHLHGLVWGFPYHRSAHDAPEVVRYTLPGKVLGITEQGRGRDKSAYYQAYLLGSPFLDLPASTTRFQALYQKEPDVFFSGRFLDRRGISNPHAELRVALHTNQEGTKAILILWNTGVDRLASQVCLDLGSLPELRPAERLAICDLETGRAVPVNQTGLQIMPVLTLEPNQVATLRMMPGTGKQEGS